MNREKKLLSLLTQFKELGINQQIDYNKFYLYSIITHSTAIEGSTVTEIENQLLFDEGISAKRSFNDRTVNELRPESSIRAIYCFCKEP